MIFVLTTSPFILNYVLKYHIEQYQPDEYTEILKNNFCVDNLHQINNHPEELIKFYKIAIDRLWVGNFNIHTCNTNSEELKSIVIKENTISQHEEVREKILGYNYFPNNDMMAVMKMIINKNVKTKRQILAESARIFDPLSLYVPLMIMLKLILRKLWLMKSNWDQVVPEETIKVLSAFAEDLSSQSDITFLHDLLTQKNP